MRIPLHWAKAEHENIQAWGWSLSSLEDAQTMAQQRARQLCERLRGGESPPRYPYGKDAIKEWCVETMTDETGEMTAAITRNVYGAYVLNAACLMIADVDLPQPVKPRTSLFSFLSRRNEVPQTQTATPTVQALSNLNLVVSKYSHLGARVYETKAGLRYLFTHGPEDPGDPKVLDWMRELKCDPLYIQLCQSQRCFRARLTPKPWRCGASMIRVSYPWPTPTAQADFDRWNGGYARQSEPFATCRYLKNAGNSKVDPRFEAIIRLHDEMTRAFKSLPLA